MNPRRPAGCSVCGGTNGPVRCWVGTLAYCFHCLLGLSAADQAKVRWTKNG